MKGHWMMTPGARLATALLFILVLLVGAGNLMATYAINNQFQRQYDAQRAAQRAQGLQTETRLCTTLGRLAALKPPSGNASANPSRAYDQGLHDVLSNLGPDIGCPKFAH